MKAGKDQNHHPERARGFARSAPQMLFGLGGAEAGPAVAADHDAGQHREGERCAAVGRLRAEHPGGVDDAAERRRSAGP